MRRTPILLAFAALSYLLSWFVPVIKDGSTLADGRLPGWEAFRVALSPIWPYDDFEVESWYGILLTVASALTNLWFLGSFAVLTVWFAVSKRVLFWGSLLAALVNAHWFVLSHDRNDLRIGYYLWLTSFLMLAVAAHGRLNRPVDPPTPGRAAA